MNTQSSSPFRRNRALAIWIALSCILYKSQGFPGASRRRHDVLVLPTTTSSLPSRQQSVGAFGSITSSLWMKEADEAAATKQERISDYDEKFGKQVIRRGTEEDEFSDEFWEEIEAGQPSEWSVMKKVCAFSFLGELLNN